MTPEVSEAGEAGEVRSRRILGIDVARSLALLGMFTVHLLPEGNVLHQLALGRASALFAVLAGVGLSLSTGGATPLRGERLRRARSRVLVRGLLVLAIGLTVAAFPTPAATILTYYGVLFVVAVPLLGLGWRPLAALAATAAVVTPVLSLLLRDAGLDAVERINVSFLQLADPGTAALTILLTGYYPVLTWLTYLLAGLAVGRLALSTAKVGQAVAATGLALAVLASVVSATVVRAAGGVEALSTRLADDRSAGRELGFRGADLLRGSFYGTTPADDGIWLWVRAPHSASIADLVQTTGTALLAIGVLMLATPHLGQRAATALAAPGAIPLTLYTLHVISLGLLPTDVSPALALVVTVAAALGIAAAVGAPARRGPLESFVAETVRRVVPPSPGAREPVDRS